MKEQKSCVSCNFVKNEEWSYQMAPELHMHPDLELHLVLLRILLVIHLFTPRSATRAFQVHSLVPQLPSSYYCNNSPALPASDLASSSEMNEFAFTLPESLSSYAGSTFLGQSSEHSTERMGFPSSSSMYGSFSGP